MIATAGFRDVLEIAYERRYDQYDLYLEKPDMIVPRDRVKTVRERIDAGGRGDRSARRGIFESRP